MLGNADIGSVNINLISNNNVSISTNGNNKDLRLKDALSALENLGYQKNVAYNIIVNILNEREDIVIESLITEALKRINNF